MDNDHFLKLRIQNLDSYKTGTYKTLVTEHLLTEHNKLTSCSLKAHPWDGKTYELKI